MHELFYRENILRRIHFTSSKLRKLNSLLVSDDFKNMTQETWNEHILDSYFYPMFPNFSPIDDNLQSMDLEVAWAGWLPGYKLYNYSSPILKGEIDIEDLKNLKVTAQSPIFLSGYYPEYFSLQKEQSLDLTYMADRPLAVGFGTDCFFHIGFSNLVELPSIMSIGLDQFGNEDPACTSYLEDEPQFEHDKVNYIGYIKVSIEKNRLSGVKNKMRLSETDFGTIEILLGEEFKGVSYVDINLANGEIINFALK